MNKTLYVRDEDGPVWERARELAGEKLSPVVTDLLRQYIRRQEGLARGFERIVLHYTSNGLPKAQAFIGRWLIPPDAPWTELTTAYHAVARTAQGNVVVFTFDADVGSEYQEGSLTVFTTLEEANRRTPGDLIEQAIRHGGVEIEELDI